MNKYDLNMPEEELKINVANDFFATFDNTKKIGKIDFCVAVLLPKNQPDIENFPLSSLLWAEAKKGNSKDILENIIQLIFTIGKAKTFNNYIPPKFLGAFDAEKILFIPYKHFLETFYKSDFNWNVTASDHTTKEFQQLKKELEKLITTEQFLFNYIENEAELKAFISKNFAYTLDENGFYRIEIDETNYVSIYHRWLKNVKPTIDIVWEKIPKKMTLEADFFIADILAENHITKNAEQLKVKLKTDNYQLHYFEYESDFDKYTELNFKATLTAVFADEQKAYLKFWQIYKRPPNESVRNYILSRRDLLIPQEVRERKGAFYTPEIWVKKSHEYLEKSFGKDWQENYYIWDCCAGTGNLLKGLTNKQNIFASTLDQPEVDYIKSDNFLYSDNVFQFDFLNDDLSSDKVPNKLKNILENAELRKKLIILINPPYAEATSAKAITNSGKTKAKVAKDNATYQKYKSILSSASNELFAQFFIRIYKELDGCKLASFSTLKYTNSENFKTFRETFKAEFKKGFMIPANTFDNVFGEFPIGFLIWDTNNKKNIKKISLDVFDSKGKIYQNEKKKSLYANKKLKINNWRSTFANKNDLSKQLALIVGASSDMKQSSILVIQSKEKARYCLNITEQNIINFCIYFAVRRSIKHTWINHNDQFLFPNNKWKNDFIFQINCLIYSIFHNKNCIKSNEYTNHFIPFTPEQMGINKDIESRFMVNFLADFKKQHNMQKFSPEAELVLEKALNLYKYYHQQKNTDTNASFYDIRGYFQGFKNGKMNSKSNDEKYNNLISELRLAQEKLAQVIIPKIYEYGFLEE